MRNKVWSASSLLKREGTFYQTCVLSGGLSAWFILSGFLYILNSRRIIIARCKISELVLSLVDRCRLWFFSVLTSWLCLLQRLLQSSSLCFSSSPQPAPLHSWPQKSGPATKPCCQRPLRTRRASRPAACCSWASTGCSQPWSCGLGSSLIIWQYPYRLPGGRSIISASRCICRWVKTHVTLFF